MNKENMKFICKLSEVDPDVFDSHPNYNSALYVAKQIAKEIDSYTIELNNYYGEEVAKPRSTQGEEVLEIFGIYGDEYFTNINEMIVKQQETMIEQQKEKIN